MNLLRSLISVLIFPGLLYALPAGWLMCGFERKLRARLQGRIGPPLSQPFFDFVKLLSKRPVERAKSDLMLLTGLTLVAVVATIGALALLPVFAGDTGFAGDLILIIGLLEMAPICVILAGYVSKSIYGEIGATREAIVSIASNVPFLAALVAMAASAGTLRMSQVATGTPWQVRTFALLAVLLCLPVKLRLNPFSLANAEHELLSGPLAEYDGRRLALWELVHSLEWVALTGLTATLLIPFRSPHWILNVFGFALLSLALVQLLTIAASSTARLKLGQATRLLWYGGCIVSAAALAAAALLHSGGN